MFAIADIKGNQYKIEEGRKFHISKITDKEGAKVIFDKVLLIVKDSNKPTIGTPYLEGAFVEAKVLSHGKESKIRVFKMKPKKRYNRTYGHRQPFTEIEIMKIDEKGKKTVIKEEG